LADNHKPETSADPSSISSNIKPSKSDSNYDLSLQHDSEEYSYHGARASGDGQYVLIFDPAKQHFVLHRIDSTFDMNLVDSPWEDAAALQSQYPQLAGSTSNSSSDIPERKPARTTKATPTAKTSKAPAAKAPKAAPPPKAELKRRKPVPAKKKAPVREPTPEDDSDDGLTIEYPDAPAAQQYQYQPTQSFQRDDSEEVSDEDAEGEEYEEEKNQDVDYLKLPSPGNNNAGGMSDEDIELDLEAELEQALKEEGGGDESSESEEE